MRLCQVTLRNTRKTVKFLRKSSKLELHSLDRNYPSGVNKYLYKERENAAAYSGLAGEPLRGTRENLYQQNKRNLEQTGKLTQPVPISDIRTDYGVQSVSKWDMNPWFFQNREWMLYGKKGDRLAYNQVICLI